MGLLTYADHLAWTYPGCRILLVRKTRASLTQSVLVTYESKVLLPEWGIGKGARRDNRSSYVYPNGSEVVCGGMDNADRIMSTEYDFVFVFEATELHEDDVEKLETRLRNNVAPYQQLACDCNPGTASHWLNRRASAGRMRRLESRHTDNPALWNGSDWTPYGRAYLARLGSALSGVRRERLLHGRWAQAEGLVYDGWDSALHVIDRMPDGWEAWPRYRSIDMGFTNPFVCQWWARDPDGRLYLYREHYRSQRLVRDWAEVIRGYPEEITATVSDHDAEDRATLEAGGVSTEPARKDVQAGIQAVASRLVVQGDGRPRLFVLRDALVERDQARADSYLPCGALEEIDGYVWAPPKEGRAHKEEPVKEHDHAMDAMRYMVMLADWQGDRSGVAVMSAPGREASEERHWMGGGW